MHYTSMTFLSAHADLLPGFIKLLSCHIRHIFLSVPNVLNLVKILWEKRGKHLLNMWLRKKQNICFYMQ